jgi:hypothetical protein
VNTHSSFDELGMLIRELDIRETHRHHEISCFHVSMQWLKSSDLACHHQRFDLTFKVIALGVSSLRIAPG